jgi:hypothetical protein
VRQRALDAYAAVRALPAGATDPIDLSAVDAIDLEAIGPHRNGNPTDDDSAWTPEELCRWSAARKVALLRRRAAARDRAA